MASTHKNIGNLQQIVMQYRHCIQTLSNVLDKYMTKLEATGRENGLTVAQLDVIQMAGRLCYTSSTGHCADPYSRVRNEYIKYRSDISSLVTIMDKYRRKMCRDGFYNSIDKESRHAIKMAESIRYEQPW